MTKRAKVWLWIMALMLVLTNGCWLYRAVDLGVTADHKASEIRYERARSELLRLVALNLPRDLGPEETYRFLREHYPEEITKMPDSVTVEFGAMNLEFEADSLVNIELW